MDDNFIYKLHIIDVESGKMIAIKSGIGVPRIGDEIRINEDSYFKVERVVWAYDEGEYPSRRVNIGVKAD